MFNMRTCPAFVTFEVALITARLLQSTKGSMIVLPKGPGFVSLDADPDVPPEYDPRRDKVVKAD